MLKSHARQYFDAQKQREYQEKVTKAQTRGANKNENLAGWYYVISMGSNEKIRLDRSEFEKPKKEETENLKKFKPLIFSFLTKEQTVPMLILAVPRTKQKQEAESFVSLLLMTK